MYWPSPIIDESDQRIYCPECLEQNRWTELWLDDECPYCRRDIKRKKRVKAKS